MWRTGRKIPDAVYTAKTLTEPHVLQKLFGSHRHHFLYNLGLTSVVGMRVSMPQIALRNPEIAVKRVLRRNFTHTPYEAFSTPVHKFSPNFHYIDKT